MKKITIITIIMLLYNLLSYSQSMDIRKTDNSIVAVSISEIDSITFSGQFPSQNMVIRKTDGSVVTVSISDVDSIIFGEQLPCNGIDSVQDADGNWYDVVGIGTQCWFKENLKTTKYNDNTGIPLVTDDTEWTLLNTPAYCWYNNNIFYKNTYGALYNWYTVNTGKLCPTGWHVPSDAEWTILTDYLGGEGVAGNKLKEAGTAHWQYDSGATNESGFTALPGGFRSYNSGFSFVMGKDGHWWSATGCDDSSYAWHIYLSYTDANVYREDLGNKEYGFSARCLKD